MTEFYEGITVNEIPEVKIKWFWEDKPINKINYYLLKDFKKFLLATFHYLGLPKPTKRQYNIAEFLQSEHTKKKIILSYRGIGKSWITCIYCLWLLFKNPDERILMVSATEAKAAENTAFMKSLIEIVDEINFLKPGDNKYDKRKSGLSFTVAPAPLAQSPSVRAKSSTGQLTGSRSTVLIFDDLEIPANSNTIKQREQLKSKYTEGAMTLEKEKDNPYTNIVFLGTPQNFDTVYLKLEQEYNFDLKIWPARYPDKKSFEEFFKPYLGLDVIEDLKNNPDLFNTGFGISGDRCVSCDPERYDEEGLLTEEINVGPSTFDLHYMLNTNTSDMNKYKLKYKNFIVDDIDPFKGAGYYIWTNANGNIIHDVVCNGLNKDYFYRPISKSESYQDFEGSLMTIDPSGKSNGNSDEAAYCITKMLNGYIFLLEVSGVPDYSEQSLTTLREVAKKYRVNKVSIEDNFGDGMFTELLKNNFNKEYKCEIEGFKVGNQMSKSKRIINSLDALLANHRIVTSPYCIDYDYDSTPTDSKNRQEYSMFFQLARITHEKNSLVHDDRLDCFASACKEWLDFIGRDGIKESKIKEEELYNKYMWDTFKIDVTGNNGKRYGKFVTV